ncbi:MAG TPA: molybdopterin-synthase adenylyltransferase MoeB [Alphaproteobacteria bacterium]|nr:molybdopterin-synthase adenylyltransferase MoeB [Alphaproteobacteria bacterium]
MDFSEDQIERYARHILLREVGGIGQKKLLAARALVIGAGGLGSPVLMYLAAAGVGSIGVVDDDLVDLSNLQRQIAHATPDIGRPKVESARDTVAALNPDIAFIAHNERLTAANAMEIISGYDIVADGSDNFATRFLVNDACYFARVPLVSAAILRFDGQVATFRAFEKSAGGAKKPCYRCIFREPPPPDAAQTCAQAGVLGALAGMVGGLQATEVLKELLSIGNSLAGYLVVIDGLGATFRKIAVKADPGCPLCGEAAEIHDLSVHAAAAKD